MIKKGIVMVLVLLLLTQTILVFAAESYYVQVGAFTSKYNAEKYSNYLSSIGYENEIKNVYGWYKVFVGPFSSEEEARETKTLLDQAFETGFVVKASEIYQNRTPLPSKEDSKEDSVEDSEQETTETEEDTNSDSTDERADNPSDSQEENQDTKNETDDGEASEDQEQSSSDTTEEEAADSQENEESTEDNENDTIVDDLEDLDGRVDYEGEMDQPKEAKDYKEFTIVLITVLWLIFILVILAYRLNQNKK